MHEFTPISAIIGGLLIGIAAASLLFFNGRIAGISGIFSGVLLPKAGEWGWRVVFLLGLVLGGSVWVLARPEVADFELSRSVTAIVIAGVLVGIGTKIGNGCTSGHGVCGNARLSKRSIVATVTFIGAGAVTLFAINNFMGGFV